jgi:steroid 5-alpha reductase family enzyme
LDLKFAQRLIQDEVNFKSGTPTWEVGADMIWILSAAVLVFMTAVMLGAWAFGLARDNGGWTDVFWTFGTGAALAAVALVPLKSGTAPDPRQWLVAGLVALWAIRLGSYIAGRVGFHAEDPRYARFRADWGRDYPRNMLFVSLPQAPATALLGLSVLFAARTPGHDLVLRDVLGVAVLLIAILGEGLADAQMKAFKSHSRNHGQVAEVGLWGWSRHPNYFFEWLGWLAYPMIGLDLAHPITWLSFAAPLVMFLLLTRVSGIPPLEEAQLRSKGDAYRAYQARVSAFFPFPPRSRPLTSSEGPA